MAPERLAHSTIDWIPVNVEKEQTGQGIPGYRHFVTIYMQEELAGARWRTDRRGTSGRSCTLVKPAAHCPENGPERNQRWIVYTGETCCTLSRKRTGEEPATDRVHW